MASQWSTGRTPPGVLSTRRQGHEGTSRLTQASYPFLAGMRQASASRQRASNAPAHRGSPSPHWYPESNGQTFGERTDYPARSVSRNGSTPDRSTAYPRHQPPHHSRAYGQDTYGRDPYSHIHMPDPHARRYSRDVFGRQAAPTPPSRGYGYGETHRPRSYGYDEVPRSRGHGYDEAARTRSYFADSYGHEARTRDPYGQESRVRDPFRGSSGQEHHSCESKWDDESRAGAVPRPHSRVHEVQSEAWSHSRTNHRDADLALPDQSPPLNRHLSNKSMSVSPHLIAFWRSPSEACFHDASPSPQGADISFHLPMAGFQ